MKFQDDISNMNTYIHTDKPKPICPHFFKVGGIMKDWSRLPPIRCETPEPDSSGELNTFKLSQHAKS